MHRRSILTGLLAAPLCLACISYAVAGAGHWGYEGHEGPEHWGEMSPDFNACLEGEEQSPIDVDHSIHADISKIDLGWQKEIPLNIVNNGHTIQVNVPAGSTIAHDGKTYKLLQFHFHHPSEHKVAHKHYEMEIHFVHIAEDKKTLTVLGVFIEPGAANPVLDAIFKAMPKEEGKVSSETKIDMAGLLPENKSHWFYEGSLTTPPCSEIIDWELYKTPITASKEQIEMFAKLYEHDNRPVQPLHRRLILED
jgi:carbonic anhydrase